MRRSELIAPRRGCSRAPAGRSGKVKGDLLVPLSKAAQAIVAARPAGDEFIFGGRRPLGNFGRHKIAFDAACGVTALDVHDLRRSARTMLSRLTTPDIAERCLGHVMLASRGTTTGTSIETRSAARSRLAARIEPIVRPPPAATVTDLAGKRQAIGAPVTLALAVTMAFDLYVMCPGETVSLRTDDSERWLTLDWTG